MSRKIPKHPLFVRVNHWLNGPILLVMIWSGLLIYWANDEYAIRLAGMELFHFFPNWFYQALDLESGLAQGMSYHFLFAWFFALNGIVYVTLTFWSGYWRNFKPDRYIFRDALYVALHDMKLRKELPPQGIFNAAQKLAYCGVIAMGFGSVVTGLAILKPVQLAWLTNLLGGYPIARWLHFMLTLGYLGFFVIHIIQVIKAGWNNFRAMVAGYEVAPVNAGKDASHVAAS